MATINPKASVRAVVEEVTAGEYVAPSAGTDFIPLRPGKSMASTPEKIDSDELVGSIGASKGVPGKESIEITHPAYFKTSEVIATAPDCNLLYKGALGSVAIASNEYDTVSSSTTTLVKVNTGEGATFQVGEALLVKNTAGYEIRNITGISGDDLTVNFALENAPGSGVLLGKAVCYAATASGTVHPSLSITDYEGNEGLVSAAAGARVSGMDITLDANGAAEVEFKLSATRYFTNPITITASTDTLDWSDTSGTYQITLENKTYASAIDLADTIQTLMNDSASTGTFVVEYIDTNGKFKFTASGVAAFSLLWNSGAGTAQTIGTKLGFSVAADDTSALTYTADNAQTLSAAYTPSYDNASNIIVKDAELLIGSQTDNVCLCASSIKITLANTLEDVDCICAVSGVQEKQIISRAVTMTATVPLSKYQLDILDHVRKNTTIGAMVNVGPKVGGNWVAGKCFNIAIPNATIDSAPVSGETILIAELTITGFATTSIQELYLNAI